MIVISLTTVPERNGTLQPTIDSLKSQIPAADMIILYVCDGCQIPHDIAYTFSKDYGPITKLSAVLGKSLPDDAIIITADDDVIYHPGWLAALFQGAKEYPECAVGFSGYDIGDFFNRKGVFPRPKPQPCFVDVLEGTYGVLYRKWMFDKDIFDVPAKYHNDDILIGGYLNKKGIVRRAIRAPLSSPRKTAGGLHKNPHAFYAISKENARLGFNVK